MHSSSQNCWVQTIYTCNISHLDIHVFTHSVFISPLCLLCKSVTFIVQYHTLDLIMRNQHKLRASARLSPFISPGPYNVPWITLQESQMTSINNWVFFSYLVNYNFVKNMLLTVIWMCDCCCYFPGLLEKIICVHKRLSLVLSTEKLNLKFSTNKNKRHYGKVWNLFLIVQLIFFLSDSVFTHPFNTKRLYMYLFLYWILIKKTIQTFSQWPPRRSRASNILLVQKINYKGTIVQKHDLDLSEWNSFKLLKWYIKTDTPPTNRTPSRHHVTHHWCLDNIDSIDKVPMVSYTSWTQFVLELLSVIMKALWYTHFLLCQLQHNIKCCVKLGHI